MSTQIESLVYVSTSSMEELKAGVAALEGADPRTIDARLRQLESTATTLSSSLEALSKYMGSLPPDDPNSVPKGPQKPVDDGGVLLKAALRMGEILESAHGSFDAQYLPATVLANDSLPATPEEAIALGLTR